MKRKIVFAICISLLFISAHLSAQTVKKGFFSKSSSQIMDDKDYGVINIAAEKNTVLLGTIMAYGENVKGLTIRINNGFPFKLAPSQSGITLNYVAPSVNIVLQPGDKAKIEFIESGKTSGTRQLYVSGEITEQQ